MIVKNSIRTPDGTELISTHRHDFVEYTDENGQYYAVDGGNEYLRRAYDIDDFKETSVSSESPHKIIREVFQWGSYGVNGDEELKLNFLKDLEEDHIKAILRNVAHLSDTSKIIFQDELEYRRT